MDELNKIIDRYTEGNYLISKTAKEEMAKDILALFNVVGRSEQLKCQCEKAKFTRTVDADFNPLCGRCGKAL